MPNVYIVKPNLQYEKMFMDRGWDLTFVLEKADLVQFTGGADVSPDLYNEHTHPTTMSFEDRDNKDISVFEEAYSMNKPMAGICRGGQFLHVMSGGALWQNVDAHTGDHEAYDVLNDIWIRVSSTHHQMMKNADINDNKEVILYSILSSRREGMSELNNGPPVEITDKDCRELDIEACMDHQFNCLSFQPHPEFPGYKYCTSLYFKYIEFFFSLK